MENRIIDKLPIDEPSLPAKMIMDLAINLPVMIMAVMGSFGYILTVDDPKMNTKRFVGTLLLSGLTAWATLGFFSFLGIHMEIASPAAVMIGATGVKGFEYILEKLKRHAGDDKG